MQEEQEKLKIDEKFITDCLANYNYRLQEIQSELIQAYEGIISKNELIETLQMKVNTDNTGSGRTNNHKDLNNILEGVEKRQTEYITELLNLIRQLERKEDALRRVWICYEALPYSERDILAKLYVEGMKWEAAPMELNISKGTLANKKVQAVGRIQKWYESAYSNTDIIQMGNMGRKKRQRQEQQQKKQQPEQLNLFDFMQKHQQKESGRAEKTSR
ncbi:MAG: hypothetical protein E7B11_26975 [Clostridiales bacterium]|nr:hypothetical protein [Clostridiales bacterium]